MNSEYVHNSANIFRPTDPGCLQYHTGTTGRIETFNFQANSQHLISQK